MTSPASSPATARRARPAAPKAPAMPKAATRTAPAPVSAPSILRLPAVAGGLDVRAPGVYFGLPEDDYHADVSLGSTDIKNLVRGPADYWFASKFNPMREDSDSPAKAWGRAFHKLVLEGPDAFAARFATEPAPADYPGCLVSADDLKAYAKEKGEPVSGTKADLIARIRKHDAGVPIFDEIIAAFKATVAEAGIEVLKPTVRAEVETAAASISENPHLANAFSGGVPEVSIFWRQAGLPLKARFDFLKPAVFLDLKRCANPLGLPFDEAALRAIGNYRYDIQVRHYLDGWAMMLEHARAGLVFGECPLPDGWGELMADPDDARAVLVFHQATGAPITKAFEIGARSTALAKAQRQIDEAKARWLDHMTRIGPATPWHAHDEIRVLEDRDLPPWMRDPELKSLPGADVVEGGEA